MRRKEKVWGIMIFCYVSPNIPFLHHAMSVYIAFGEYHSRFTLHVIAALYTILLPFTTDIQTQTPR